MNVLYVIGGVALTIFGTWETIHFGKKLAKEGVGLLGASIQLLGAGITSIIIGVFLIIHYL
jgi:hypothetical protein